MVVKEKYRFIRSFSLSNCITLKCGTRFVVEQIYPNLEEEIVIKGKVIGETNCALTFLCKEKVLKQFAQKDEVIAIGKKYKTNTYFLTSDAILTPEIECEVAEVKGDHVTIIVVSKQGDSPVSMAQDIKVDDFLNYFSEV